MNRPKCRYCGRPLTKTTYSQEVDAGAPAPAEIYGKKVVSVVFRKSLTYRAAKDQKFPERISLWCGEWGRYGDGKFCGINCGYGWAIRNAV